MIRIIYLLLIWIHGMNWMLFLAKGYCSFIFEHSGKVYISILAKTIFGKMRELILQIFFHIAFAVALERLCSFRFNPVICFNLLLLLSLG